MKRDMDLVRQLLLSFEDETIESREIDDRDVNHIEMLLEQGLVDGVSILRGIDGHVGYGFHTPRLTWTGHEFLETIRQKTVWEKIKKLIDEKGVGLTIDGIKFAAPLVVKSMLGAPSQG